MGGLSSIICVPSSEWPSLLQSVPTMKSVLISCLRLLNENINLRKQKAEEVQNSELIVKKSISSALKALESSSTLNPPVLSGYGSDEDVKHQNSYEILDQTQFNFTNEDEFEDEDSVVTAIDGIEEITLFFDRLQNFAQREALLFQQIMALFSPDEQHLINSLNTLSSELKNK